VLVVTEYRDDARLPKLLGARRDAGRIATALRSAGYKTTLVLDADRRATEKALAQFERQTRDADVAIIYTTGHGLEVLGESYILMRDFNLADGPEGLKVEAMPVAAIARSMKARTANMIFSAACRDNPLHW
ncbi:MAG: caspase family protein, partial [Mesorhizobium sp.]